MMGRLMTDWLEETVDKLARGEKVDMSWYKPPTKLERLKARIIKWFCDRYC
jgi:hypothetical protein